MLCPSCNHNDSRVLDTRTDDSGNAVRRRRECNACCTRFTTSEEIVLQLPKVAKSNGDWQKFSITKVRRGLSRSLEKRPVDGEEIELAVQRILRQFSHHANDAISSHDIGEAVMSELRQLDEVAYVRFASVYRHFQDVESFSDEVEKLRLNPLDDSAQQSLIAETQDAK